MLLAFLAAILSPASASDAALLQRIAMGDRKALRELYDRCAPAALALARRILRGAAEAEDVVQDVFVEAWLHASRFDPRRGNAVAWLLAMARSRALDRVRARGVAERAGTALVREDARAVALPIEPAQQRQERERIQAALAALPPEQRETLLLAYFEGLSQSEIAARTGEALGTVKTRCRLALEKLSRLLQEVEP